MFSNEIQFYDLKKRKAIENQVSLWSKKNENIKKKRGMGELKVELVNSFDHQIQAVTYSPTEIMKHLKNPHISGSAVYSFIKTHLIVHNSDFDILLQFI